MTHGDCEKWDHICHFALVRDENHAHFMSFISALLRCLRDIILSERKHVVKRYGQELVPQHRDVHPYVSCMHPVNHVGEAGDEDAGGGDDGRTI